MELQNREIEIFVPIIDYDGYEVSNYGTVVSFKQGYRKELTPKPDKDGYLKVSLFKNGKTKYFKIHRLVAMHFIPNPNEYPMVIHKNGDRLDNYYENLLWCTAKYKDNYDPNNPENNKNLEQGEVKTGRTLTPKEVIEIKRLLEEELLTQKQIADRFKVSVSTIQKIKYGIHYSDIDKVITNPIEFVNKDFKPAFKLTERQALDIYIQANRSANSLTDIANQYGIDRRTVGEIRDLKIRSKSIQSMLDENGNVKEEFLSNPIKINIK